MAKIVTNNAVSYDVPQSEQIPMSPSPKKPASSPKGKRRRGNGTGSVKQTPDGQWKAIIITRYYTAIDDNGVPRERKHTKSRTYPTQHAAELGIKELWLEYEQEKRNGLSSNPTLADVYQAWDKWYDRFGRSKQTTDCYHSAYLHLKPLYHEPIADITIDQLQNCLDNCPRGKRTRENLKTLIGLLYKYAVPRSMARENLSQYLIVSYNRNIENIPRQSLNDDEIDRLFALAEINDEDARDVCCLIYLGLRPSEFLSLRIENINLDLGYIVGGSKTEAGIDRVVTIAPRIAKYMHNRIGTRTEGYVFGNPERKFAKRDLKRWSEGPFRHVLERARIDNPMVDAGGGTKRRRITPHNCRHTFARLVKKVNAPVEDKMALIGHANEAQLRDYMDSTLPELKRITDQLN